jgi:hypothetical protein
LRPPSVLATLAMISRPACSLPCHYLLLLFSTSFSSCYRAKLLSRTIAWSLFFDQIDFSICYFTHYSYQLFSPACCAGYFSQILHLLSYPKTSEQLFLLDLLPASLFLTSYHLSWPRQASLTTFTTQALRQFDKLSAAACDPLVALYSDPSQLQA